MPFHIRILCGILGIFLLLAGLVTWWIPGVPHFLIFFLSFLALKIAFGKRVRERIKLLSDLMRRATRWFDTKFNLKFRKGIADLLRWLRSK